ncbi:hypothetical protein BAUCODRAFT_39707 [Baudoinia panamericana UAMH 10762]|uniref:Uncharacterized protein n=1 Tax=Baudoinia panamericana (strain UAMH 10762) TaxID=717646 RepID=M2M2Y7_BAUPA|nr:uncharacterized protein BAUCODRAFT_39707 [Baudoinia panamericana UAMH 10762]EMC90896.1 hypothetical protein BAUCODRAFT_39707 [Baudoinia panamericana UAMH 10762]
MVRWSNHSYMYPSVSPFSPDSFHTQNRDAAWTTGSLLYSTNHAAPHKAAPHKAGPYRAQQPAASTDRERYIRSPGRKEVLKWRGESRRVRAEAYRRHVQNPVFLPSQLRLLTPGHRPVLRRYLYEERLREQTIRSI